MFFAKCKSSWKLHTPDHGGKQRDTWSYNSDGTVLTWNVSSTLKLAACSVYIRHFCFSKKKNILFSKRGSSAAAGCFPDLSVISPAWALCLQCIFTWQRVDQPVSSCASLSCQVRSIKRTAHPQDRQPGKGKKWNKIKRYSSFSLGWHSSKDSETHYKYSWRGWHFYFRPQSKCSSWGSARWCPCLS